MAWLSNQFPPCTHDGQPAENVLCVIALQVDPESVDYEIAYWNLCGGSAYFTLMHEHKNFGLCVELSQVLGYQRLSEFKLVT